MTLATEQQQSIREHCLPYALDREVSMRVGRAWSTVLATIAAGFFFGGIIIFLAARLFFGVPNDAAVIQWLGNISAVLVSVFGAFATMGFLSNKDNGVMTLNADEMAQLDVPEGVWNNLGTVGRSLLVVFGTITALGVLMLFVVIIF